MSTLFPEEVELAEYLHSKFCRKDHTRDCFWDSESWVGVFEGRYPLSSKSKWLNLAVKTLKKFPSELTIDLLNILGEVK